MSTFRAKVFVSKDGDRFLVPGYWYDTSDVEFSSSSLMLNAQAALPHVGLSARAAA